MTNNKSKQKGARSARLLRTSFSHMASIDHPLIIRVGEREPIAIKHSPSDESALWHTIVSVELLALERKGQHCVPPVRPRVEAAGMHLPHPDSLPS